MTVLCLHPLLHQSLPDVSYQVSWIYGWRVGSYCSGWVEGSMENWKGNSLAAFFLIYILPFLCLLMVSFDCDFNVLLLLLFSQCRWSLAFKDLVPIKCLSCYCGNIPNGWVMLMCSFSISLSCIVHNVLLWWNAMRRWFTALPSSNSLRKRHVLVTDDVYSFTTVGYCLSLQDPLNIF